MAGRKSDFTLTKLDDLFSTQEQRDEEKLSKIRDIPLTEIDDFPDHPFKVRDDEDKYLVDRQGIRPEEIIVISYTNKAIGELKDRINKGLGIGARVCTFHSFAFDIVKKFSTEPPEINFSSYKIISEMLEKANSDPEVQARWRTFHFSGDEPTVEEFILWTSSQILAS